MVLFPSYKLLTCVSFSSESLYAIHGLAVNHLAHPVLNHNRLIAANIEASLAGKHPVLEVLVALIASLCYVNLPVSNI